jgi:hypothetical protein
VTLSAVEENKKIYAATSSQIVAKNDRKHIWRRFAMKYEGTYWAKKNLTVLSL